MPFVPWLWVLGQGHNRGHDRQAPSSGGHKTRLSRVPWFVEERYAPESSVWVWNLSSKKTHQKQTRWKSWRWSNLTRPETLQEQVSKFSQGIWVLLQYSKQKLLIKDLSMALPKLKSNLVSSRSCCITFDKTSWWLNQPNMLKSNWIIISPRFGSKIKKWLVCRQLPLGKLT